MLYGENGSRGVVGDGVGGVSSGGSELSFSTGWLRVVAVVAIATSNARKIEEMVTRTNPPGREARSFASTSRRLDAAASTTSTLENRSPPRRPTGTSHSPRTA